MEHFTFVDLLSIHDRPAGLIKDILFSQAIGYTVEEKLSFWYLNPPIRDGSPEYVRRGPYDSREAAWKSGIKWSTKGGIEIYSLMKRASRPDTCFRRSYITEKIVDGEFVDVVNIKWRMRGYTYVGESSHYADAAMNCYLKYLMRLAKVTGTLDLTEAGIGLAAWLA